MTLSGVTVNRIDYALGSLPPGIGENPAVIGPAVAGSYSALAFGRKEDIVSTYTGGPLVEAASYINYGTGKAVTCVRSATTTTGGYGTINVTGVTGTSAATADAAVHPIDEFEAYVEVVTGGTIASASPAITYRWSLDNGRSKSAVTALGTATSITIPGSVGVKFNFASGTLVAGDVVRVRTTPPKEGVSDMSAAYEALRVTALEWDFVLVANCLDASEIASLELWMQNLKTPPNRQPKWALCNVRGPTTAESFAAYVTAAGVIVANVNVLLTAVASGYSRTQSAVNARRYRRPVAWVAAVRAASAGIVGPAVSLAKVALGPLPADVQIMDENGQPCEHNEELFPGMDASRFLCLRTRGKKGVFIEKDRIMASVGSDYDRITRVKVMNKAEQVWTDYLENRVNGEIRVNAKSGFILDEDALEIENGGKAAIEEALLRRPDASDAYLVVARNNNILATRTLICDGRVVPLANPENITLTIGFSNPAARIQPV